MIDQNPLFSKENIKKVASILGQASWTLIYDGNDTPAQLQAGKSLLPAKYIVAAIGDHIFDYYPYRYFCNEEQVEDYKSSINSIISFLGTSVISALDAVDTSFPILETVTRDKFNQHRVPRRKLDEEKLVTDFFLEVLNNIDEFEDRFQKPKKKVNISRPSDNLIQQLVKAVSTIQDNMTKHVEQTGGDAIQSFQFNQVIEMFKLPLYCAWQLYNYGWHTDFMKEGESMYPYMMFEMNPIEITSNLINTLKTESPFRYFERNSMITNGLLDVYTKLLNGLKSGELKLQ